jgi:hypothetical protein
VELPFRGRRHADRYVRGPEVSLRLLLPAVFLSVSCTVTPESTDLEPTPILPTGSKPAGAACARGDECAGGTCLGAPGQPEEENPRFSGGYCTRLGCAPGTQDGCGADEYCVESGHPDHLGGGYCVELCSRAAGLTCDRADHVCVGLGHLGGCYSQETIECDRPSQTGCAAGEICVRIGFEEDSPLGRCETLCDPLADRPCGPNRSCYYIKAYNASFCATTGTSGPDEQCLCDKCCVDGYACTPDLDGSGRHCKPSCGVASPTQCSEGETCVPIEINQQSGYVSPVGGCAR